MADETQVDIATTETETVDFDKELQEEIAKTERAEQARKGYEMRHKEKTTETLDEDDAITKAAEKVLARVLPRLEATAASNSLEVHLNQMTSDPSLKNLIKHHFDHSVGSNGSVLERLENAQAIALKKVIAKQAKQLNVAVLNRQQISNTGMGSHSKSIAEPKDNILSEAQIASLKAQGKDDKFIDALKRNLMKR